ncbi:uncharacterized protein LOC112041950 [Lingula anatina]|nr:uncharacterized protein LOC112041950 [Lingula anatina]|eukprot:XP_023931518.1 uncharacterized protein LOC112041950 [Lingula anatina]
MLMAIDGISQISHRLTKDASPAEIVNMKVQCATKIQAILEKSPPTVPEIPKLCFKFSPTTNELLKGGFGYLYLDDGRPSMLNKIRIPLLSRKKERLYSLDASTSGDIIISTFCEKDPALNRIFILDREARAVKQKFGVPNMSSMTYLAASVTSHHKECLVVTDPKQGMIYVFDTAGILISSLICPKALAVSANSKNQPIIQTHGHQDDRIHRLNLNGGVIKSFSDGNAGDDKGVVQLKQLSCSKSNGDILVSDPMNACVRSYSQEGELKFTYTSQGAGSTPSEPFVPFGICTNEKGDIFVTDTNNKTIHRLSSKGEFKELVLTKADGLSSEPMGVVVSGNGQLVVGLQDGWVKVYSYR